MPYVFSSLGNLQGMSLRQEAQYNRQEAACLETRAQNMEAWASCSPVLLADAQKWRREAKTLRSKAEEKRKRADKLDAQVAAENQATVDEISRLRRDADVLDQIAAQLEARAALGGRLSDIQRWRREAEGSRNEAAQSRAKADALEAAL